MGRRWRPSARRILAVLADGRPKSQREIVKATGMSEGAVWAGLRRCWQKGLVFRSRTPLREKQRAFKGRAGVRVNLRSYNKNKGSALQLTHTYLHPLEVSSDIFFADRDKPEDCAPRLNGLNNLAGIVPAQHESASVGIPFHGPASTHRPFQLE